MNENMRNDVTARMSVRLLAVADMMGNVYNEQDGIARRFKCVADVGCDHGYVSICLVQKGIAQRAIAMDVRKGPLSMAEENISQMELSDRIDVRLSDGLAGLEDGEADGLVIAGMGGRLIMSILEQSDISSLGIKTALLQPQSELELFRDYLDKKGYRIIDERIVLDDGKYYFPMLVEFDCSPDDLRKPEDAVNEVRKLIAGKTVDDEIDMTARRLCNRYGAHNILRQDALLKSYLEHGREVAQSVLANLDEKQHPKRTGQLRQELGDIELLL
jgi:tRNA (adenine22-N1)-methyltransferase